MESGGRGVVSRLKVLGCVTENAGLEAGAGEDSGGLKTPLGTDTAAEGVASGAASVASDAAPPAVSAGFPKLNWATPKPPLPFPLPD